MKTFIVILLAIISIEAFAQKKVNTNENSRYSTIDGVNKNAVEPAKKPTVRYQIPRNNKKRVKLTAPRTEFGFKATGFLASMQYQTDFSLADAGVYIGEEKIGTFQRNALATGGFQNTLTIPNYEASWWSATPESSYQANMRTPDAFMTMNYAVEIRRVRYTTSNIPRGYFVNLGTTVLRTQYSDIRSLEIKEMLFPVGAGFIVPGERNFHIEFAGNAVLSRHGVTGSQFEFSFVVGPLKFGPSYTHTVIPGLVRKQLSSPGIHVGLVQRLSR